MRARVDGDRLKLARWLRRATQKAVSENSGLSQAYISKLENGFETADDADAELLERALNVAPGFLRDTGARSSLPEHFYRKRASLLVGDQRWIESVVSLARRGIASLCESMDIEPLFDLPQVPLGPETLQTPAGAAQSVRRALMIPDGPIRNLEAVIESTGTIIIPIYGAPAKFDAMASPATVDSPWNLIFYNPDMPGDRLRFTLAHEFGHLVMHRTLTPECEDEANQFGFELLAPQKLIGPHLRNLDLHRALQLKNIWGVSIGSLVYQAHQQNRITESRYKSLQVMISKKGWRRDEPGSVEKPTPALFSDIVAAHREDLGYSWDDIGQLFGVSGHEFQSQYTAPEYGLRVVK